MPNRGAGRTRPIPVQIEHRRESILAAIAPVFYTDMSLAENLARTATRTCRYFDLVVGTFPVILAIRFWITVTLLRISGELFTTFSTPAQKVGFSIC